MNQDKANALVFPKAKKFKMGRVLKRPVLIEEKLDGHRYMIWKDHAYGRNLNKDQIRENRWDLMPDSIKDVATSFPVDGEVIWPKHESTDVLTGMKANCIDMEFVGFRVPDLVGDPLSIREWLVGQGVRVPQLYAGNYLLPEDIEYEALKIEATEANYEGWILKEKSTDAHWWKLKLEWTYDLVVMDLKPGKGKYEGYVGAIICGLNGVEIAACSGMDDVTRAMISVRDVGRVVEVKCNGICSQGRLRHPQFVGWRDDKIEADCLPLEDQG